MCEPLLQPLHHDSLNASMQVSECGLFLTVRDGGRHRLLTAGAAVRDGPHRVPSIVVRADKQVSSAFPHQALQLLHRGTNTPPIEYLMTSNLRTELSPTKEKGRARVCTRLDPPACPRRAARRDGQPGPTGPPGRGCSQSESCRAAEDAPAELPRARGIFHICNRLEGCGKERKQLSETVIAHLWRISSLD